MISWKLSFRRLNEENDTAKKKKQVLDNLLSTNRISQSTHNLFDQEIAEAISEIEKQQKSLLAKMDTKTAELEEQIETLEILLANFEIQHVTGEIDDETYQKQISVLSAGLGISRNELSQVKDAMSQLSSFGISIETATTVEEKTPEQAVEFIKIPETEVVEEIAERKTAPETETTAS